MFTNLVQVHKGKKQLIARAKTRISPDVKMAPDVTPMSDKVLLFFHYMIHIVPYTITHIKILAILILFILYFVSVGFHFLI